MVGLQRSRWRICCRRLCILLMRICWLRWMLLMGLLLLCVIFINRIYLLGRQNTGIGRILPIVIQIRLKNSYLWLLFKDFFYLCSMNQLIYHIEFLLHEHNCVIIPDLGGFVINAIQSSRDSNNALMPPSCELVFN